MAHTIAWVVIRYEHNTENVLAFVQLAWAVIRLRIERGEHGAHAAPTELFQDDEPTAADLTAEV